MEIKFCLILTLDKYSDHFILLFFPPPVSCQLSLCSSAPVNPLSCKLPVCFSVLSLSCSALCQSPVLSSAALLSCHLSLIFCQLSLSFCPSVTVLLCHLPSFCSIPCQSPVSCQLSCSFTLDLGVVSLQYPRHHQLQIQVCPARERCSAEIRV